MSFISAIHIINLESFENLSEAKSNLTVLKDFNFLLEETPRKQSQFPT